MGLLTPLGKIADALERIAAAQEMIAFQGRGGNGLFSLTTGDKPEDAFISYVDDASEYREEKRREEYAARTGRRVSREEALPSPDPREWV